MNDAQLLRYSRQIMVPEIDIAGQEALLAAAGDGIDLSVDKGPGAGDVTLSWSGGAAPYDVYRSTDAQTLIGLANYLGQTGGQTWQDTPPVGTISDALVLSPECDGVVLVVQAGGLPREVIQRCKARLDSAKARLLGVLLNKVDIEREKQYYYYYNYYASYYGYGQPGSDGSSS